MPPFWFLLPLLLPPSVVSVVAWAPAVFDHSSDDDSSLIWDGMLLAMEPVPVPLLLPRLRVLPPLTLRERPWIPIGPGKPLLPVVAVDPLDEEYFDRDDIDRGEVGGPPP